MGLLRRVFRSEPWDERDAEFVAFYRSRAQSLRATAYLLSGDWHLAEDLTQSVFIKLYRAWHRIERRDTLDQYARRVLVRAYLDERRRPWRRERTTTLDSAGLEQAAADRVTAPELATEPLVERRLLVRAVLQRLPDRQRAVLVLRYWADLPVERVAEVLGCSPGTVKSQTARALTRLRELLAEARVDSPGPVRGGGT